MAGLAQSGRRLDHNLHVTAQLSQALQHLGFRNAAKPSAQHIGELRLRHAEQFCCLHLRHSTVLDNLGNLGRQLSEKYFTLSTTNNDDYDLNQTPVMVWCRFSPPS